MNLRSKKLYSLILAMAMLTALFPISSTVSATTGTITNITVNPNRPVANTGGNQIRVATPLAGNATYTYGDQASMTFAHMGASLKGCTQIYVPRNDSNRTATQAMKDFCFSTQEYFNFTPSQPGAVYVISSVNLATNTDTTNYKNNYASWISMATAGPAIPSGYSGEWAFVPYNYEPADAPTYFSKIQWKSPALATAHITAPDVSQQTSTNIGGRTLFPYAYKKYFAANTPVSIPVVGYYTLPATYGENIVVLIDWNDTESSNAKLTSLTYTPNVGSAQTVTGFDQTAEGGTYNVELPIGTTSVAVSPTASSTGVATMNPTNGVVDVTSGSGTCTVTVTSGTLINTFTVNFTVASLSSNTKLSSLTYTPNEESAQAVTGFSTNDDGGTYNVVLSEGTYKVNLQSVVADTGKASVTYDKTVLTTFPGTITATVTAENGSQNSFKVTFDLPGYIFTDDFDRHGSVGTTIKSTLNGWSSATADIDSSTGALLDGVVIGMDPKDSTNMVGHYVYDNTVRYPALKKNLNFNSTNDTITISGQVMLNKLNGPTAYLDIRKLGGAPTTAVNLLRFEREGPITLNSVDATGYNWIPGEWIKYTITLVPNATDMTKCSMKAVLSGGIADTNQNPSVCFMQQDVDLSKTEYLSDANHAVTVIFNSLLTPDSNDALYLDNVKIYNPSAGSISIPNNSNISVTDDVEIILSKYEFNPATLTPNSILVTNNTDSTLVAVSSVVYDPLDMTKFNLHFADGAITENNGYTVTLDGTATDMGGNPLTGTGVFYTMPADPITALCITPPENLTFGYGTTATFTASTTPAENVDYNTIIWYVDGIQAATGKSFTYNPTALGQFVISASISDNPSITAEPKTVTVTKGTQSAPAIEVAKTYNTITITPVTGAEYGIKLKASADEVVYGINNVFTGLVSNTEYTAYIRMTATEYYQQSSATALDVTTEAMPIKYGDINSDGVIDISDVIMAAEIAVGNTGYTDQQKIIANVSSKTDMAVDISDVVLIAERAVGGIIPFPVDEGPVVIFKLDDLRSSQIADFQTVATIAQEKGIKVSFGIIGSSLEDDGSKQSYYDAIGSWVNQGIEIWHHGYSHTQTEYHSSSYESQLLSFQLTCDLMQQKCDYTFHTFGSPYNNADSTTIQMLNNEFPQIKTMMLVNDLNNEATQKILTIRCDMEASVGVISYDTFINNYNNNKESPYVVLQGHPASWDSTSLAEFIKIVDFLKSEGVKFMTPYEYTQTI